MKRTKKYCLIAVFTMFLGIISQAGGPLASMAAADPGSGYGNLPLDVDTFGASYGEWSARWWQWILSIPFDVNPNFDSTGANCGQGQAGNVWFLAGTFGGDPVTRRCTIPSGKGIFFPVINTIVLANSPTDTIESLRTGAVADIDTVITMRVTIDGSPLKQLHDLRVQSPVFSFTIPDTLFGPGVCSPLVPEGPVQICPLAVSDGYWVLLSPFRKGPHVIKFYAKKSDGFVVDVTYNLTVGP